MWMELGETQLGLRTRKEQGSMCRLRGRSWEVWLEHRWALEGVSKDETGTIILKIGGSELR